jgi:hypothetical protein
MRSRSVSRPATTWVALRLGLIAVSGAATLFCVLLCAAGYAGLWRLAFPDDRLFLAVIALGAITGVSLLAQRVKMPSSAIDLAPPRAITVFVVFSLLALANTFVTVNKYDGGEPTRVGGQYATVSHGRVTFVSREQWQDAHAVELQRAPFFGVFFAAALLWNLYGLRSARGD